MKDYVKRFYKGYRLQLRWTFPPPRQPILPFGEEEERLKLKILAQGRRLRFTDEDRLRSQQSRKQGRFAEAFAAVGLHYDFDLRQSQQRLSTESRTALEADINNLLPDRLVWHFPSQSDGRWPPRQRVILATYDSAEPLSRFRRLALVATSPDRRSDPRLIHLDLESVIPENHQHRWEAARWLWDERAQSTPCSARWGIETIPFDILRQERHVAIAHLHGLHQTGNMTDGERAALAILQQDEGKFDEALALYDMSLGTNLWKIIGGETVFFHHCHRPNISTWAQTLQRSMWHCAPWLLRPSLRAAANAVEPWHSADRGKQTKVPTFRLYALRGQRDARKTSLMLSAEDRTIQQARFDLEQTGSNRRLPEICWRRPVEIDFLRFGVQEGILAE